MIKLKYFCLWSQRNFSVNKLTSGPRLFARGQKDGESMPYEWDINSLEIYKQLREKKSSVCICWNCKLAQITLHENKREAKIVIPTSSCWRGYRIAPPHGISVRDIDCVGISEYVVTSTMQQHMLDAPSNSLTNKPRRDITGGQNSHIHQFLMKGTQNHTFTMGFQSRVIGCVEICNLVHNAIANIGSTFKFSNKQTQGRYN